MSETSGPSIESPVLIQIPGVPAVVTMAVFVILVLAALTLTARAKMKLVPNPLQNFFEFVLSFWWEAGEGLMGHEISSFFPLFTVIFFYVLFGNLLGLVPGFLSPTSNLSTNAALALIVFLSTHYFGIRKKGFLRYFRHFIEGVPWWLMPLMFIIHMIGELVRPVSLTVRLFGNLIAKEIILSVLVLLILIFLPSHSIIAKSLTIFPFILRPLIVVLGTLVGVIQASVFTILSMIYIGGAVSEGHEH